MFIISLNYKLRMSIDLEKENDFIFKKIRSRQYPAETIKETDYADDLALLVKTSSQSLLHSVEQPAGEICFNVNINKTDFMCFRQEEVFSS